MLSWREFEGFEFGNAQMNDLVQSCINRTFLFREELTINAIPTPQQASAANLPNRGQSVKLDIDTETARHPEKKHEDHSLPNSKWLISKYYLPDGQGSIRAWLGDRFWLEIQTWSCHLCNDKSSHPAKPSDRPVFFLLYDFPKKFGMSEPTSTWIRK
jgi:hypothetical protein